MLLLTIVHCLQYLLVFVFYSSLVFDRCMIVSTQLFVNALWISHAPSVHPSKPHLEPLTTTERFTLSKDLHFPDCNTDGLIQYVGFLYWLLLLINIL